MKKNKKKSTISLLGIFIKKNPWSSFWTLLIIMDFFQYGLIPIQSFPDATVKTVWLLCFILLTIIIGIVLKISLFKHNSASNTYGIEDLTEWVDQSPGFYFIICLLLSGAFEFIFGSILKDIALSYI